MRIPVMVMMCTPPAMIPSRSGFTFGHMGGIISVSRPAAVPMPLWICTSARSFTSQARDNYRVILKDDGLELVLTKS